MHGTTRLNVDSLQTLDAFLAETDLPPGAAQTKPGDWGLEQILREKSLYDQNLNFEKDASATVSGWSEPCPTTPIQPEGSNLANGLAVVADQQANTIIASFVNNTAGFWNACQPPEPTLGILSTGRNILSLAVVKERFFLSGQMDGSVAAHDLRSFKTLASVKAHSNYAVQVTTTWDGDNLLIATAGWDKKISIHLAPDFQSESSLPPSFSETFITVTTPHNVQSLLFARHPDTNELHLVYTIRDSIHLHYLRLTQNTSRTTQDPNPYIATPAGRQSLAPQQHSRWTSFTPAWLEASPVDPTLIAVATSHTPSMKLIITRLLFPTLNSSTPPQPRPRPDTTAPPHGAKDELAIKLVATTNAPQNDYSTPRCAWRPDGSGLWVSGDDGVIRGIDAETGKIARELKGHEQGSKIRALWAGMLGQGEREREVLVSGGFDRRVLVWEVAG